VPAAGGAFDVHELLGRLVVLLLEHGSYEERSLYHELRNDPTFVDTARSLCGEHLSIHRSLQRALDSAHPTADLVIPALTRLRRHIMKEERGLFPPAVILLSTEAWERAAAQS
jgi:hemerythrin-like domain-containing protein